jgi:ketosteroid isomerase-like protein
MRTLVVGIVLLFVISGCAPQQPSDQLTPQQVEQIKADVKALCDTMWTKWQKLDVSATMGYMADSPDFVAYNPDGSRVDYQAFKKMLTEMAPTLALVKISAQREDVYVMSKDVAVYAWFGKSEIEMKSGEKVVYDPDAETLILKKIAGQWKIVYAHESATIVTQKPGKK